MARATSGDTIYCDHDDCSLVFVLRAPRHTKHKEVDISTYSMCEIVLKLRTSKNRFSIKWLQEMGQIGKLTFWKTCRRETTRKVSGHFLQQSNTTGIKTIVFYNFFSLFAQHVKKQLSI